jgi:hypothetical protein
MAQQAPLQLLHRIGSALSARCEIATVERETLEKFREKDR